MTQPWHRYLTKSSVAPQAAEVVTLPASPASYEAPSAGFVLIGGGSVSGVTLTRGRVSVATGVVGGFIPVGAGDSVTITYSAAPEVHFFAS